MRENVFDTHSNPKLLLFSSPMFTATWLDKPFYPSPASQTGAIIRSMCVLHVRSVRLCVYLGFS